MKGEGLIGWPGLVKRTRCVGFQEKLEAKKMSNWSFPPRTYQAYSSCGQHTVATRAQCLAILVGSISSGISKDLMQVILRLKMTRPQSGDTKVVVKI